MAEELRATLRNLPGVPPAAPAPPTGDASVFFRLGDGAHALVGALPGYLSLFVEAIHWSTIGMFGKKTMLRGSTTDQMILLGSSALPITLLLSFLIGLTLALQSAVQLELSRGLAWRSGGF